MTYTGLASISTNNGLDQTLNVRQVQEPILDAIKNDDTKSFTSGFSLLIVYAELMSLKIGQPKDRAAIRNQLITEHVWYSTKSMQRMKTTRSSSNGSPMSASWPTTRTWSLSTMMYPSPRCIKPWSGTYPRYLRCSTPWNTCNL